MNGRTQTDPLVIGLTGNIATGKSTVSAYLHKKGAYIVDADKVAHRVMEPGQEAYAAIVAQFGTGILADDGRIERSKLGEIVFQDADRLGRLEQIVHPAVYRAVYNEIEQSMPAVVILEAVKLLEAGSTATLCDEIWVVVSDPQEQVRRATGTSRGCQPRDAAPDGHAVAPSVEDEPGRRGDFTMMEAWKSSISNWTASGTNC